MRTLPLYPWRQPKSKTLLKTCTKFSYSYNNKLKHVKKKKNPLTLDTVHSDNVLKNIMLSSLIEKDSFFWISVLFQT